MTFFKAPRVDFIERIVRPFVALTSESDKQEPVAPPEQDPEAFVRWGGPSKFDDDGFRVESKGGGVIVEQIFRPLHGDYWEESRAQSEHQVSNPENPSQFVMVPKNETIVFAGPPIRIQVSESLFETIRPQVSFNFTNPAAEPPFLFKNTDGEEIEPVVLDPFTTILEVGWAGQFVLLTTGQHGSNVEIPDGGGAYIYISILDTIGFKVPPLAEGEGANDSGNTQYPADADTKDIIIKHMGHWEFSDTSVGQGTMTSGQMWLINMSALVRAFAQELFEMQVPPTLSLWWSHVGISVVGKIRVSVYNGSALLPFLEGFTDPDENPLSNMQADAVLEALAPENFLPSQIDKELMVQALSGSTDHMIAIGGNPDATEFTNRNYYDFRWDYLNRFVQGVLPQIVNTAA